MTDAKIATIYDNYKNIGSVKYLPEKVEGLRKKATLYGLGTSLAFFIGNEVSRFTLRSPLFKLKPLPILLVAVMPISLLRYWTNNDIDDEVRKFWRIHKTREEKGLGGSYRPSGQYPNQVHNAHFVHKFPLQASIDQLLLGKIVENYPDNPSMKMNDGLTKFNAFHADWDRNNLKAELYESKRAKSNNAHEKSVKMNWFLHSIEDNDDKVNVGGIDNDHPMHEAPDENMGPAVDHKLDERFIFAFRQTPYGTNIIDNMWDIDPKRAAKDTGAPSWYQKMFCPDFFDQETSEELLEQLKSRSEFNFLKAKWSFQGSKNRSHGETKQMACEYSNFINKAYEDKGIFNFILI